MSLINELKTEITRMARKEIKKELDPVKRINANQRSLIANLRRDITELQREVKRLQKELGTAAPEPRQEEESTQNLWISGKRILSTRKRLGLTQAELAKLADVTTQSVVKWEKTEGKIAFRQQNTLLKLLEIRSMGKIEAREKLGEEAAVETAE